MARGVEQAMYGCFLFIIFGTNCSLAKNAMSAIIEISSSRAVCFIRTACTRERYAQYSAHNPPIVL